MKNLLLLISMILVLQSCSDGKTYGRLTEQQRSFFAASLSNTILSFQDSNTVRSVIVGQFVKEEVFEKSFRGGMFSPEPRYYYESGLIEYKSAKVNDSFHIRLVGNSETPYYKKQAFQNFEIYTGANPAIIFNLKFDQKLPFKKINNININDIIYAISDQDTLFWRQDLGILGWTKKASGYTVYRVF